MQSQLYFPISLFLKISDFCPNNCMNGNYCFSSCSPDPKRPQIKLDKLEKILADAKELGFIELAYVSSEPFTDLDLLSDITKISARAGITPRFLVTNGRIGNDYEYAKYCFEKIRDLGFDISLPENYYGSGYNGVDVSVDQFHNISPGSSANTILAALEVFGPTAYVSIRTTIPGKTKRDLTALKRTIELLTKSGNVRGKRRTPFHELFFNNGSRVAIVYIPMDRFGNARNLPPEFFQEIDWSRSLREYKDLHEEWEGLRIPYPFHKLYLDPDGNCYPELCRLPRLSGGNLYEISLSQAIANINDNPIAALMISSGLRGLLKLLKTNFSYEASTRAPNYLSLAQKVFENQEMIDRAGELIVSSAHYREFQGSYLTMLNEIRQKKESFGKLQSELRPKII